MDEIDLRDIEQANPIIAVAIELGVKVRGNMGKCFKSERHSGADQAMTLFFNPSRNSFFCKSCQDVGGSVVDLVSQYRSIDREEAIAWLAHRSEFDILTRQRYGGKGRKKI
ncbi:MAG: hypothetical protein P4L43_00055 [Syntrophobacteraceae bacterium]|nr:hypothetical protein [Syntrophobacteraceae bacterium]